MLLILASMLLIPDADAQEVDDAGLTDRTPVEAAPPPKEEEKRARAVFTEDFEIRYWVKDDRLEDPNDVPVFNYVEQVNRLNAVVGYGRWNFAAQVDEVALFANRYYLDDVLRIERQLVLDGVPNVFGPLTEGPDDAYLNLEKLSAQYEADLVTVNLGDFYASLSRGVALNLNRNVDIDIDTSIQGAKATFRPGAWDLTVLAGQLNRQQVFQDNPNTAIFGDRRHFVVGTEAVRYGLGPANIGMQGVLYNFVDEDGIAAGFTEMGTAPDAVIGGASTELIGVGGVDWFAEVDVVGYPTERLIDEDDPRVGHSAYASAAIYSKKLVWLVEFKRYKEFEHINRALAEELYEVALGPTLEYERQITEDSSATVNSNDIVGGRIRADVVSKPGHWTPYASLAVYRDAELGPLHFNRSPETIFHPVAGFELVTDVSGTFFNMGYRYDRRDDFSEHGADRQTHADFQTTNPLFAGLVMNLAVAAEYYEWGKNEFQQENYFEMEASLGLTRDWLTVTWFNDVSTNPLIDSVGNLSQAVYGACEVQVKPSPAVTLKAFYGAYKSGIRCSGGQCRLLPGFEGARFSATATF